MSCKSWRRAQGRRRQRPFKHLIARASDRGTGQQTWSCQCIDNAAQWPENLGQRRLNTRTRSQSNHGDQRHKGGGDSPPPLTSALTEKTPRIFPALRWPAWRGRSRGTKNWECEPVTADGPVSAAPWFWPGCGFGRNPCEGTGRRRRTKNFAGRRAGLQP